MLARKRRTAQQRAWLKVKQWSPLGIGETRSTLKGRRDRCEAEQQHYIRAKCVARDGDCRIATDRFRNGISAEKAQADCDGRSEWAHLGDKKRFKTRRMNPMDRHTMEGSLMLCTQHHQAYDAGTLRITPTDPMKGADGVLEYFEEAHRVR